jgi:hypothetical protein
MTTVNLTYRAPTSGQLADAQAWIDRFAAIWARPEPERLRELMNRGTRNLIPPMPDPGDSDAVVAHFKAALERLPDLRLSVVRWAPVADSLLIEWEATATAGREPITWRGVDRVSLSDGKTYEGQVYWDTRALAERVATAMALAKQRAAEG